MKALRIPGFKPEKKVLAAIAIEDLVDMFLEYQHSAHGPFKMLRLDRYFEELEKIVRVCMEPPKGGKRLDNRKKQKVLK